MSRKMMLSRALILSPLVVLLLVGLMDELVFTFEASKSGREGVVYLDHIVFER